ncbi:GPW/gp25 family protein [Thermodesulfovibrio thiophilus]|uniref:GPW/gp25 family protein n=1 Tax=Thermodesulfovibrio thiophilus TaxID=340095 RepID=UPI00041D86C7|nr:GPW/gp25 family protein [Thermodesulfovibrio thiophilus]
MYSLVERDTVKSILQNIRLILTTVQGSDIHRPDFGSRLYLFIDKPLNAITIGRIKVEIKDAILKWEQRVEIEDIALKKDYINAKLNIQMKLRIKETEEVINTQLWL